MDDTSIADANHGLTSSSNDLAANPADRETNFWKMYLKEAGDYDRDLLRKNRSDVEGVLIFAGLFSAVSASFLVASQADLSPNPTDITNSLLMALVNASNNSAIPNQSLVIPVWNGPSSAVVSSQMLGYAALSASLLAALGAVLGKQWLGDFARLRSGPLQERGHIRQWKLDGLEQWRFEVFMGTLPALMQLALLLFSMALAINLWELNRSVGLIVITAIAIGVLFYFFITLASLLSPTCPYHTPVSTTILAVAKVTTKSVEVIAGYWAWNSGGYNTKQPPINRTNKILANLVAVFFSSTLIIAFPILLTVLATFGPIFVVATWILGGQRLLQTKMDSYCSVLRLDMLRLVLHKSMCLMRDSAHSVLNSLSRAPPADLRPIAWLLETSVDPDSFMAAAELIPDVKWPDDLRISLPNEHMCSSIFIHSISAEGLTNAREHALQIGKAVIIMLCCMSNKIHAPVWWPALRHTISSIKLDMHPDLRFILTIVIKLLSHRFDLESPVEFPLSLKVSQSLLAWLLQPLEILLQLDHPPQSSFLPEAHRVFLELKWLEGPQLEGIDEVQYCRTFEAYFNIIMRSKIRQTTETMNQSAQEWNTLPAERLKETLEKLKKVDPTRLPEVHQHFIAPLTAFSRLASTPGLNRVIKDAAINPWVLTAFKEAVSKADEGGKSMWLFAGCLLDLAADIDAFNPVGGQVPWSTDSCEKIRSPPLPTAECLLSYLLNCEAPATSQQLKYALEIMLASVNEDSMLASDPRFIDYILYATGPGQVYSIRDIGLKVLIDTSQSLLRVHDTASLALLAISCNLSHFLRRAIFYQHPPTILKDLLSRDDEASNEWLLPIIVPAFGDPFNALLTRLRNEPSIIPDCDLRDLEIALVLCNSEGRKKLFFDHLDQCIATMALRDRQHPMALPLTAIVGWLLRRDGPLNSSELFGEEFLRSDFGTLLFFAWGDPDELEDNPHMLRMLPDCTSRWLSAYVSPRLDGGLSQLPIDPIIIRLQRSLEQLGSGNRTLSWDIKRALRKLSWEISQYNRV